MSVVFVYRPFTVVSVAQIRHLWRAGYAERCPSGSEGDGWKRARKSNALAVYPIVEVTDSSSVSPIIHVSQEKPGSCKTATWFFLAWLLLFPDDSRSKALVAGAVNTGSFLDTTLGID
jgi:hypothetical protein